MLQQQSGEKPDEFRAGRASTAAARNLSGRAFQFVGLFLYTWADAGMP
jgi:hypothetical protein